MNPFDETWGAVNYNGKFEGWIFLFDSKGNASGSFNLDECRKAACYKYALMKSFECVMHNDDFFDEFLEPVPNFDMLY